MATAYYGHCTIPIAIPNMAAANLAMRHSITPLAAAADVTSAPFHFRYGLAQMDPVAAQGSHSRRTRIRTPCLRNLVTNYKKPGEQLQETWRAITRNLVANYKNLVTNYKKPGEQLQETWRAITRKLVTNCKKPDSENCMKCPDEEWPNEEKDLCVPKLVEFLSYRDDIITSIFSSISALCCLLACVILWIFVYYKDTTIVKANNKNLSYLLLVSIMLGFLCVFFFLGPPSDVTCRLRVTSFGVIFSVAISSLFSKSIMVFIAFKATKPGNFWKKWMGTKLPNFVVAVCSLVQIIICVLWLSISPPFQELDLHSYQEKFVNQCNEGSVIGFYSVLGYMGLLAAVSFITAFLARTLPDIFNEAKYITFSMLVFCSVWIAMIPAYLSTKGKNVVAVQVFAIMASSSGLLACIFFPKCYIILCRPELNTKNGLLRN
ncbi:vomeronasal type-2 receptor 26-like [Hyperolius riggenbachi]|uniref:vomeronasal type-2 receptor 26-like n=1 Tax=Hyperolius riggenbachi TaxID=752182 RepID=UPI0035A3471D